jgi:predicted ATPase
VTRLLAAGGPAGIPFGVGEAIRRRLARLAPACRDLLAAAAVAGPEFTAALLARATGQPAGVVRDLLSEAVRAQVVAAPPGPLAPYRFAHDLFREAILEELDGPARARLHLAVGRALEAEGDAGGVPPA